MALSTTTRDRLAAVSTATLTTVLFKRGFRNVFIGGIKLLNPDAPRLVGQPTRCAISRPARISTISASSTTAAIHSEKELEECLPGAGARDRRPQRS